MEQSQNISDRLSGAVLRIDVDKKGGNISHPVRRTLQSVNQGTTGDYYIPSSNPFVNPDGSVFEEYYALGCRNPHRMTIDRVTGLIYIGNVGSNSGDKREEINRVASGANFGWPYREGFADRPDLMARPTNIIGTETDPIHEYGHINGNAWVCGGYVYRGDAIPEYKGHYIFADGGSRKIWALDLSGTPPYTNKVEITTSQSGFFTMGEDQAGELYLGSNNPQKIVTSSQDEFALVPDGNYFVRVRHSQKYLEVSGSSQNNGATIQQSSYTGAANQQWEVKNIGGNQYMLTCVNSGKVLDVQAFGTTDGSNVHQWTNNNTSNQKWIIESEESTYFRIKGLQSSLDLEVVQGNNNDGGNVQIGDRETSNNFNQLWEFIPVSGGTAILPSGGLPTLLSQTNAFKNLTTLEPEDGIIPYDVITELWSDGSDKYRWIALPNDGTHDSNSEEIIWSEEGEWTFPIGTVFIKHFELQTDESNASSIRRLETRFLIHGETGYYALTYRWLPDGSDAELLETSFEENINITKLDGSTTTQKWYFPSRSECFICHTEASGQVLGIKTRHLNRNILYPSTGITANQIETYNHIGMFDQDLNVQKIANYLTSKALEDNNQSIEDRARSYLDINCSSCHRPGGGTRATWNALLSQDLWNANIINGEVVEDLGIEGAKTIVPGDTARSILYQRIKQVNTSLAMPPLAKNVQHEDGVAIIAEWINNISPNTGGLTATYFNNMDFTDEALNRLDPTIDFNWGNGSPDPVIDVNTFSVRWEGFIEVPTSGSYTFYTNTDDGVRLWVNGQLIIEDWTVHAPKEISASINLSAQTKIPIKMEFFENGGGAVAQLRWSSNNISKQIIPSLRLYPKAEADLTIHPASGNTPLVVIFDGSNNTGFVQTPLTYNWNFGDGITRSGTRPTTTHTYNYPGDYTASLTISDGIFTSTISRHVSVGEGSSSGDIPTSSKTTLVKARAYLQGPWNGTNLNSMLFTQNILPLAQPYSDSKWGFPGTESILGYPNQGSLTVVDWVLLRIHDPNNPESIVAQRACLLKEDGWILDLDGGEFVDFGVLDITNGYISIVHRNHLGVMTQLPVDLD